MKNTKSGVRARLLATSLFAGVASIGAPVALTAIAMAVPGLASAQDYTSGVLVGTVTNDTGAAVAGASVTITSAQGQTRTATTNAGGVFQVPALTFGPYTVAITAPNYADLSNKISVTPQGANYSFTLRGAAETVSEIVITGTRKVADFSRTDTGLVVDVQELSSRVPLGRNITSVVLLTPGANIPDASINAGAQRNQTLASTSGTSAAENAYYINGLNVTDQRTFLGFADLPFDAIQTIDIKTGGYQAEFGRATGSVINTVTKSGTNEYHFGASAFYTPNSLREQVPNAYGPSSSGNAGTRIYNDMSRATTSDYDVYISGPIIKDHLFFYGIVDMRKSSATGAASVPIPTLSAASPTYNMTPTAGGSISKVHYDTPLWLTKVDFNITDKQRIEMTLFSDAQKTYTDTYAYDRTAGIGGLSSSTSSKAGGLNQIYKYTGVFTDWFTLSAQYGQVRSQFGVSSPQAGVSRSRDYTNSTTPTYLTAARSAISVDPISQDIRESARIDADLYFHLMGDHHVRGGFDREGLRSNDNSQLAGGAAWDFYKASSSTTALTGSTNVFAPAGTIYARQLVYSSGGTFKAEQNAYYLQDSWELTPKLTLQLGVRNDTYNYKTGDGKSFINLKKQWAPRLGFTYDVTGDRSNKLYGSFGRYYLPIAENTAIREAAANPYYYRYYNIPSVAVNATGQPTNLGSVIGSVIFGSETAPDSRTVAASNIKPQYETEIILGFEHQFRELTLFNIPMDGLKVGVNLTARELGQAIEDTDLGYAVDNYCARKAIASCTGANSGLYEGSYTLLNPGKPATVFLDLVNGPGSGSGQYINLTSEDLGIPEAKNKYVALDFTFDRPFDGKWGLGGSYVLSRSRGNYEGGVNSDIGQTDTSITQDFDNRFFEYGQYGDLPNDHRHTFKLYGTYSPFENFTIGANGTIQSGRSFSCLGYDYPADPTLSPSPSQRYCPLGAGGTIIETPRGSMFKGGWTKNVDLNFAYHLPTPDKFGGATVSLDVFNVFNAQTATRIVEQGVNGGNPNLVSPVFQLARSYQSPRAVRFGIRYAF